MCWSTGIASPVARSSDQRYSKAVAIGGFRATGTDASGKAFNETGRFTDTWMEMPGGKWLCVASQDALAVK